MKLPIMIAATVLALSIPAWATDNPGQQWMQLRLTHNSPARDRDRMEIVHHDGATDAMKELLFVDRKTLIDQSDVKSAAVTRGADGLPRIELSLTDAGRQSFARAAKRDDGKRVAILIDGTAITAGNMAAENAAGIIELSGDFTQQEAQSVADKINQATRKE